MSIIDINTSDIFNAIGGGSPLSIIDSVLHPSYSIRNNGSATIALEFSGMASIQPSAGANIVTAPIENGKYQSINKVARPGRVVCDVVISGLTGITGSLPNIFDLTFTSQSDTLTTIKSMIESTALYDIDTPKDTYESYDLIDYSYSVNGKRNVSMLVVSLIFEEVRQQMDVQLSGGQTDGVQKNDDYSSSPYGLGSGDATKQCAVKDASVDNLKLSWGNLNKAVNDTATNVAKNISTGFTSAINTVKEPLANVANSTTQKAINLVGNINGAIQ